MVESSGGCFFEKLPHRGSVKHLVVVNAEPGKLPRLRRGLGPFQAYSVDTVMTWKLTQSDDGSDVSARHCQAKPINAVAANFITIATGGRHRN